MAQNRFSKYAQDPLVKPADPMKPGQLLGQALSNQEKAATVPFAGQNAALDNRSKSVGIQRDENKLRSEPALDAAGLAKQYAADPRVADYRDVLPQITSAMSAPDNAQGDLSIIYGFAKVMDPGSAVRGEEMSLAQSTSPLLGRLQSYIGMVNNGKRLPPDVRKQLINTMRGKGHQFNLAYSEARKQYSGLAKQGGFPAELVVGPHDGGKYQQVEADFKGAPVVNLDGGMGAAPAPDRWRTVTDDEIRDFIIQNQGMAIPALQEYAKFKLGRSIDNLPQVMESLQATGKLSNIVNRTEAGNAQINGLAQGLLHPLDRAAAGLEQGFNALTGANSTSARDVNAARDDYFAQIPVDPGANTLGRVIGAGAMSAPFGGPMFQGAISGALMGDSKGLNVGVDAALGAAGGKVGDTLLKGGARLLGAELDPAAKRLANEGVKLTPGRMFPSLRRAEDLGADLPFVGNKIRAGNEQMIETLNRVPANRALKPIGESLPADVPAGHEAVAYTGRKLGDFYEKTLAGKEIALDPTFATRLNAIGQKAGLRPQELAELGDIVVREMGGAFQTGPALGKMSGKQFKALDEKLGKMVSDFKAARGDPYKRQLGETLGDVVGQFHGLARRQSPDMAAGLRAADEGWANYVPYRSAAQMAPTDGLANPGQFRTAVRQSDRSVGKGATARGEALMQDFASDASRIVPSGYGNSGTSPREEFLRFNPWSYAKGAALSPMWSEPVANTLQSLMARSPGPFAQLSAETLRAIPGGALGGLLPLWINSGK